jgi:hypothetical protein
VSEVVATFKLRPLIKLVPARGRRVTRVKATCRSSLRAEKIVESIGAPG